MSGIPLIERQPDLELVGAAADGLAALHALPAARADVVLMDVSMPHMDGIEATRLIRRILPRVAVAALSVDEDRATRAAMLGAGALAFVAKHAAGQELPRVIRKLLADRRERS